LQNSYGTRKPSLDFFKDIFSTVKKRRVASNCSAMGARPAKLHEEAFHAYLALALCRRQKGSWLGR
jgi:hypothetical protein